MLNGELYQLQIEYIKNGDKKIYGNIDFDKINRAIDWVIKSEDDFYYDKMIFELIECSSEYQKSIKFKILKDEFCEEYVKDCLCRSIVYLNFKREKIEQ